MGAGIFGKSELGARIPFILMGLILVLLTYKVATQLSNKKAFHFLSAFLVATSPVLIFVSKVPNESIVAATLFLFLFYLLNEVRFNTVLILLTIILLILTSKFSWFILMPFLVYTVIIYRSALSRKDKLVVCSLSLFLLISVFAFFLHIPQGMRSLSENNLSLFSDITTKNGINRLRGQGLESGWPPILEQILINKLHFFRIGLLHWLSNIQPAVLFSQFSKDGTLGFAGMGAFPKAVIVPALMGLIFLIREKRVKLLLYPLVITLPTALIYPQYSPQIVILTLPFISFVIAFGFLQVKKILAGFIIIFMLIELLINFFFLSYQAKTTNQLRPYWIKPIVQDAFKMSNIDQVFISDDITQDPASFIEWYTPFNPQAAFLNLPYPYKFRQTNLGNIKLVGFSDSFRGCGTEKKPKIFLTKRDLDRVKYISSNKVVRTYLNSQDMAIIYYMEEGVCLN